MEKLLNNGNNDSYTFITRVNSMIFFLLDNISEKNDQLLFNSINFMIQSSLQAEKKILYKIMKNFIKLYSYGIKINNNIQDQSQYQLFLSGLSNNCVQLVSILLPINYNISYEYEKKRMFVVLMRYIRTFHNQEKKEEIKKLCTNFYLQQKKTDKFNLLELLNNFIYEFFDFDELWKIFYTNIVSFSNKKNPILKHCLYQNEKLPYFSIKQINEETFLKIESIEDYFDNSIFISKKKEIYQCIYCIVNQNETKYFSLISIIMKPIFSMLSQTFSESNGDYINFIKYKYKFPTKDQLLFILSIYEDLILPYENYIMNHLSEAIDNNILLIYLYLILNSLTQTHNYFFFLNQQSLNEILDDEVLPLFINFNTLRNNSSDNVIKIAQKLIQTENKDNKVMELISKLVNRLFGSYYPSSLFQYQYGQYRSEKTMIKYINRVYDREIRINYHKLTTEAKEIYFLMYSFDKFHKILQYFSVFPSLYEYSRPDFQYDEIINDLSIFTMDQGTKITYLYPIFQNILLKMNLNTEKSSRLFEYYLKALNLVLSQKNCDVFEAWKKIILFLNIYSTHNYSFHLSMMYLTENMSNQLNSLYKLSHIKVKTSMKVFDYLNFLKKQITLILEKNDFFQNHYVSVFHLCQNLNIVFSTFFNKKEINPEILKFLNELEEMVVNNINDEAFVNGEPIVWICFLFCISKKKYQLIKNNHDDCQLREKLASKNEVSLSSIMDFISSSNFNGFEKWMDLKSIYSMTLIRNKKNFNHLNILLKNLYKCFYFKYLDYDLETLNLTLNAELDVNDILFSRTFLLVLSSQIIYEATISHDIEKIKSLFLVFFSVYKKATTDSNKEMMKKNIYNILLLTFSKIPILNLELLFVSQNNKPPFVLTLENEYSFLFIGSLLQSYQEKLLDFLKESNLKEQLSSKIFGNLHQFLELKKFSDETLECMINNVKFYSLLTIIQFDSYNYFLEIKNNINEIIIKEICNDSELLIINSKLIYYLWEYLLNDVNAFLGILANIQNNELIVQNFRTFFIEKISIKNNITNNIIPIIKFTNDTQALIFLIFIYHFHEYNILNNNLSYLQINAKNIFLNLLTIFQSYQENQTLMKQYKDTLMIFYSNLSSEDKMFVDSFNPSSANPYLDVLNQYILAPNLIIKFFSFLSKIKPIKDK